MVLISVISDQNYKNNLSKINQFVYKIFNKIFRINAVLQQNKAQFAVLPSSNDQSDDTYAYSTWFAWTWYVILLINIISTVHAEITIDKHYINATSGILLCLPWNLPIPIKSWSVSQKYEYYLYINDEHKIFEFRVFGTSLLWIIAYCSWNLLFLYGDGRIFALWFGLIHISVPVIRSLWKKRIDLFWNYRAFALAVSLFLNTIRF